MRVTGVQPHLDTQTLVLGFLQGSLLPEAGPLVALASPASFPWGSRLHLVRAGIPGRLLQALGFSLRVLGCELWTFYLLSHLPSPESDPPPFFF